MGDFLYVCIEPQVHIMKKEQIRLAFQVKSLAVSRYGFHIPLFS